MAGASGETVMWLSDSTFAAAAEAVICVVPPVTFAADATPGTASAAAEVMAAIVRVRVINLLPRDLDSGTQKHVGRGRVAASAAG